MPRHPHQIPLLVFALTSACAPLAAGDTHDTRQKRLDGIASKCHLPRSVFKLEGMEDLRFQASPDMKFENVDCALAGLKKMPFAFKLGFIGNEQYRDEGNSQ